MLEGNRPPSLCHQICSDHQDSLCAIFSEYALFIGLYHGFVFQQSAPYILGHNQALVRKKSADIQFTRLQQLFHSVPREFFASLVGSYDIALQIVDPDSIIGVLK